MYSRWRHISSAPKLLESRPVVALSGLSLVSAGNGFAISVLMAKSLGAEGRGEVGLMMQVAYMVWPIAALGMDRLILRGPPGYLPSASGLLHVCIAWVAAVFATLSGATPAFALGMGSMAALGSHLALMRAEGLALKRINRYVIVELSMGAWLFSGALALSLLEVQSTLPWMLLYGLPGIVLTLVIVMHWLITLPRVSLRTQWDFGRKGLPLGVTTSLAVFAFRADRLVIPAQLGPSSLGAYLMAATPMDFVVLISVHRIDVQVPVIAGTREDPTAAEVLRDATKHVMKVSPMIIGIAAVVGLVFLPWLGEEFLVAQPVVPWLALGSFVLLLYRGVNAFNLGSARPRGAALSEIAPGVVAFPAYWMGVSSFGLTGAGIASVVVYVVAVVSALIVFNNYSGGAQLE